jgi:arylsulfatase A-like enzyme
MKALVIVAGGLHLGYVGCYGNDWIETPALDDLAAAGIVFDQHYSDHPDAIGARRSWRTGHFTFPLPDEIAPPMSTVDLVALLREHRVATSLIIDGSRPHVADFAVGWDEVEFVAPEGEGTPMERTLEAALAALDRCAALDHWLIWVELATLRPPWDLPEDYVARYFQDEETDKNESAKGSLSPLPDPSLGKLDAGDEVTFMRLQRTYAAAVTYLDTGLGLLIEELDRRGLMAEALLIVTSDHGLPLGEHGVVGLARPWLHDELIHVPVIIHLPEKERAGRRITALTQALDLCPTLLDAFGVLLPRTHGHSLLTLAREKGEHVRAFACCGLRRGEELEWSLRTSEWAFLLPLRTEVRDAPRLAQLYVKPDDRWEVNNLLQHHWEEAEELERKLRAFVAATRSAAPLSETK